MDEMEKDGPQRRVRTKFTTEQIDKLEKIFAKHKYLDAGERVKTAQKLNLSETQVRDDPPCMSSIKICVISTRVLTASLSTGENLVPEQEDEAEARGAGLPLTTSSTGDVPALTPVPVPSSRRTATSLSRGRSGFLPAACSEDASPTSSTPADTPSTPILTDERLYF